MVRPTGLVDPPVQIKPASTQVDDLLGEIRDVIASNERVLVTTLTKRMAEDLTDYLGEHDIRVRYLHSDIDTVERMEIIRDLRLGEFDVLVGINLLREGLDMPEVSLVAVLDADKEGFLRSEGSLIQTMGRAARNARGRVILYADQITKSMRNAMDETQRRRTKQIAYNEEHDIVPKTISKRIGDVMEGARSMSPKRGKGAAKKVKAVTPVAVPDNPKALGKLLEQMEKQMLDHAQNLEFEEAAALRDQVIQLKREHLIG